MCNTTDISLLSLAYEETKSYFRDTHSLNTRKGTGTNFGSPKPTVDLDKRAFSDQACQKWNKLPDTTRGVGTIVLKYILS